MAIAILGGGLWLLQRVTRPPMETASKSNEEDVQVIKIEPEADPEAELEPKPSADSFRFSETTPLTTDLLPEIQLDPEAESRPTPVMQTIWRYRYNVALLPTLQPTSELQTLVEDIKQLAIDQNLPPEAMSVVLIDLNKQAIATYQPNRPQYPASVAKLFWMVALYGQFQQGLLNEADFQDELRLMVARSDNNATSQIIDAITRTEFQAQGTPEEYKIWYRQRFQLNQFFTQSGYQNLNITQKTYPIPDIEINEPTGFDLQMRQNPDSPDPIRNQLTASHAARLMYEIVHRQAIAPVASEKMLQWLRRDLTKDWRSPTNFFNPVQDFFGAGLPPDAHIFSKAGWTTQGRHEVAYITSANGAQQYILCIFAEQKDYAENESFFPDVAAYTYQYLVQPSR